ncbi:hypothetical protein EYF80_060593 [Liparis tanakae]|uniref:Uncharacterized protein n=1 Tax=Liparis tanakae TaxID=230148 RepID=A0A4Z2EKH1_9TELE|nr:hypothetical protein EYF80_060593 [Liparis tanakae]
MGALLSTWSHGRSALYLVTWALCSRRPDFPPLWKRLHVVQRRTAALTARHLADTLTPSALQGHVGRLQVDVGRLQVDVGRLQWTPVLQADAPPLQAEVLPCETLAPLAAPQTLPSSSCV